MKQQKLYIKNENMSKKIEFIDLGLPSGRIWAKENEEGYFTYDKAKEKFGELLPKPEAFKELWENCQWLWDVKNKGMIVVGPNKNTIFLPGYLFLTASTSATSGMTGSIPMWRGTNLSDAPARKGDFSR